MNNLQLKDVLSEVKEVVFGGHNIDIEKYVSDLSERSYLAFDDIKNFFNLISLYKIDIDNPKISTTKRRIWSSAEDKIVDEYVEIASRETIVVDGKEKNKRKDDVFKEIEDLLEDRTAGSTSMRYYDRKRKSEKENKEEIKPKVEAVSTPEPQEEVKKKSDSEDLLDLVVGFVDNVDNLDVNLNELFRGLLTISDKAVKNDNSGKIEELEGKASFLEAELEKEKIKNESLQRELLEVVADFKKMKGEIEYFNGLNGKQKLQQLHSYNSRLKCMVDKFGGVITVGA